MTADMVMDTNVNADIENSKKHIRKIVAFIAAAVISCAVLLSPVCLASSLDHDCPGENCPVCARIDMFRRIAEIGAPLTAAISSAALFFGGALYIVGAAFSGLAFSSLVDLRVKLSD